jgi:hypothetical protein
MQSDDWFSVDRKGLANLLGDRKPRLVLELTPRTGSPD